jgi:hypothetical protein
MPSGRRGLHHRQSTDFMDWLFDILISNKAAALFIAILGVSVFAITWRLYRQD